MKSKPPSLRINPGLLLNFDVPGGQLRGPKIRRRIKRESSPRGPLSDLSSTPAALTGSIRGWSVFVTNKSSTHRPNALHGLLHRCTSKPPTNPCVHPAALCNIASDLRFARMLAKLNLRQTIRSRCLPLARARAWGDACFTRTDLATPGHIGSLVPCINSTAELEHMWPTFVRFIRACPLSAYRLPFRRFWQAPLHGR